MPADDAVEFKEGLFVEGGIIKVSGSDIAVLEAEIDGIQRERRRPPYAVKPFLPCRRNDPSITEKTGRRIMPIGGNSEDIHVKRRRK